MCAPSDHRCLTTQHDVCEELLVGVLIRRVVDCAKINRMRMKRVVLRLTHQRETISSGKCISRVLRCVGPWRIINKVKARESVCVCVSGFVHHPMLLLR